MAELPGANMSPRIVHGALMWYAGDIFQINVSLDLVDQDGYEVAAQIGDEVKVTFSDARRNRVYQVSTKDIVNNGIKLVFDDEVTKFFRPGEYTYDIDYYHQGEKTTISRRNTAVVE